MRKKIVAGNWKMNKRLEQAYGLMKALDKAIKQADVPGVGIIVAPPVLYTPMAAEYFEFNTLTAIGAQNVSAFPEGAYTGEVSAEMLASVGVDYCLVGHSERRAHFHEDDETFFNKAKMCLSQNIQPIFCVGEDAAVRKSGDYLQFIKSQLDNAIFRLSADEMRKIIIAYEPVWAIGTGETASPGQAQEVHEAIRSWLGKQYDKQLADDTTILYGGSCKASNADELFACKDIDGGLIGGASLDAAEFVEIIKSLGKA